MTADRIVNVLLVALLTLAALSLLYQLIHFIVTEVRRYRNHNAPVCTERATVWQKHSETQMQNLSRGNAYVYFITFHMDFGQILWLYMNQDELYRLEEGSAGQLTWQGNKFWDFVPETM